MVHLAPQLIRILLAACLASLALTGCVPDAPRDNPVDPLGDSESRIEGWVFSYYEPRRPVADVAVTLLPSRQFSISDETGYVAFSNVAPGSYRLVAAGEGFAPDTIAVVVGSRNEVQTGNLFLNAVPVVETVTYYSRHVDQLIPGEVYEAYLNVTVADGDGVGDVAAVTYRIPALDYERPLSPTPTLGEYQLRVEDTELLTLYGGNLYLLTENHAVVEARDRVGARGRSDSLYLRRIIDEAPRLSAPAISEVTGPRPRFQWEAPRVSFDFTYALDLQRLVGGIFREYAVIDAIPGAWLDTVPADSLPDGEYRWTLEIRDNLGNASRSKPFQFIVTAGPRMDRPGATTPSFRATPSP